MIWWVWVLIAGGAVFAAVIAIYAAPARTTILIDTATSTSRAEMRLLWGMGPMVLKRLLPQRSTGSPLAVFNDAPRIAHALMTPGLAESTYRVVRDLFALHPKVARFELRLNLGDAAKNLVVQTAAQAVLALAPAKLRESVSLGKCEAPGAEIFAKVELNASPLRISSIYTNWKESRASREFQRRLKRKPKPVQRPVREVRS